MNRRSRLLATLEGWFTEDFTLAELRALRAKERIAQLRQHDTIYEVAIACRRSTASSGCPSA